MNEWMHMLTRVHTLVVGTSDVFIQASECFHGCKLHEEGCLIS